VLYSRPRSISNTIVSLLIQPISSTLQSHTYILNMRLSTITIALSTFSSLATAIIYGIQAPSSIIAGSPFTITLLTEDYIQSVYDVAVAFGIQPIPLYCPGCLGLFVFASEYLGPPLSNVITPINFNVTVDAEYAQYGTGPSQVHATLYSLMGASLGPVLTTFALNLTVGDTLSSTTVTGSRI